MNKIVENTEADVNPTDEVDNEAEENDDAFVVVGDEVLKKLEEVQFEVSKFLGSTWAMDGEDFNYEPSKIEKGGNTELDADVIEFNSEISTMAEYFDSEFEHRLKCFDKEFLKSMEGSYRFDVKGPGGGIWYVELSDDEIKVENKKSNAKCLFVSNMYNFTDLVNGVLNPQIAILSKKVRMKGDIDKGLKMLSVLSIPRT